MTVKELRELLEDVSDDYEVVVEMLASDCSHVQLEEDFTTGLYDTSLNDFSEGGDDDDVLDRGFRRAVCLYLTE